MKVFQLIVVVILPSFLSLPNNIDSHSLGRMMVLGVGGRNKVVLHLLRTHKVSELHTWFVAHQKPEEEAEIRAESWLLL